MNSPNKATHPVYSDFSHIASGNIDIGSLTFAVGLREENPEEMVSKILPLTKIVPGEFKPRTIRKVGEKAVEEKICSRPECVAKRDRYSELNAENELLREQMKALESKVAAAKNKNALTEKSMQITEDRNESLRGQIEDIQASIFTLESDVQKGETSNQLLRDQLNELLQDLERQRQITQRKDEIATKTEMPTFSGPNVVFGKSSVALHPKQVAEVKALGLTNQLDIDSDDDN